MMVESAFDALGMILSPERLMYMSLGILLGAVIGILPGLGGTVGMAILLPFVFGMDPFSGVALLIGMTAVVHSSDLFPSIMMGVPGSSGSQATIMDGYPLARRGEAGRALGAALSVSMVGGLIGAVTLVLSLLIARPLVLALGSPELFMLTLLGLSMVGILSRGSARVGLLGAALGMLIGTVGIAPAISEYRYTFDSLYLTSGIPLPVFALGLFALPEIVDLLASKSAIAKTHRLGRGLFEGVRDGWRHRWLVVRSSVLGAAVGLIPGLGGSVVDWIAYGFAKQTSKDNENFGKGDIRGVIGPEAANNAKEGGALIPTLLFGIPGSGTTAMLLGGLVLLGVQAGPAMVSEHLDVTLSIVWTLALANVFAAAVLFFLSRWVIKIGVVPPQVLAPFLFVIIVVAAYQSTRQWGDIVCLFALGIVGWIMKQLAWPRAPLLIGFILAPASERYLHISMSRYGTEWFTSWSVLAIGLGTLVLVFYASIRDAIRGFHQRGAAADVEHAGR